MLIAERVMEVIGKAMEHKMPNLAAALVVDITGGRCERGQIPPPGAHLVIIDGDSLQKLE